MSLSQRARDRMEREAADASTSGVIPLGGFAILAFIVAALLRLIL